MTITDHIIITIIAIMTYLDARHRRRIALEASSKAEVDRWLKRICHS